MFFNSLGLQIGHYSPDQLVIVSQSSDRSQEVEETIDQVYEITPSGHEVLKRRTRRASRADGKALTSHEVYAISDGKPTIVKESVTVEPPRVRAEWEGKFQKKEETEEREVVDEHGKKQKVKVVIERKIYDDGKVSNSFTSFFDVDVAKKTMSDRHCRSKRMRRTRLSHRTERRSSFASARASFSTRRRARG